MSKDSAEEENPSWLDAEHDDEHRQEVQPLFGAGNLNLNDPEEETDEEHGNIHEEDTDDDLETAVLTTVSGASSKKSDYGSTATTDKSSSPQTSKSKKKVQKATKNKIWPFLGNDSDKKKKKKKKSSRKVASTTQEEYDDDDPWPKNEPKVSYNQRTGRPERPIPGCCLAIFYFVETYAILTCLCLLISQTLPLILIPAKEIEPVDLVLKVYVSIFSVLFMLVEWGVNIPFIKNALFLQTFMSRGFLYSFLGLTCLEEAYSERVNDMLAHANDNFHVAWFALFLQVSAWSLCFLGVLYFVMGLFCLKRLRDKLVKEDRAKWKEYREAIKEWQKNSTED